MNFGKRLASIFQFGSGSGQTRTEIWQAALRAIKERPILGWGADTFRLVFPKFKPVEYVRDAGGVSVADNAHNYPLQLATGIGIPGMLLLYGIFVWAGVRSFGTVFRRSDDSSRLLVGAFWAAAAGYLVHLMFSVPAVREHVPALGDPGHRARAHLAGGGGEEAQVGSGGRRRAGRGSPPRASAIRECPSRRTTLSRVGHECRGPRSRRGPSTSGRASTPSTGPIARSWARPTPPRYRATCQRPPPRRTPARTRLATRRARKRASRRQRPRFEDAIAFQPDEYDNYVSFGDLYNLGGQTLSRAYYADAIAIANRGLQIEPYGTYIRSVLGYALLSTGKTDEGISVLEASMKMDPGDSRAALLLAQAYQRTGRAADALALLKSVEERHPGQGGVAEAIQKLEAGSSSP